MSYHSKENKNIENFGDAANFFGVLLGLEVGKTYREAQQEREADEAKRAQEAKLASIEKKLDYIEKVFKKDNPEPTTTTAPTTPAPPAPPAPTTVSNILPIDDSDKYKAIYSDEVNNLIKEIDNKTSLRKKIKWLMLGWIFFFIIGFAGLVYAHLKLEKIYLIIPGIFVIYGITVTVLNLVIEIKRNKLQDKLSDYMNHTNNPGDEHDNFLIQKQNENHDSFRVAVIIALIVTVLLIWYIFTGFMDIKEKHLKLKQEITNRPDYY